MGVIVSFIHYFEKSGTPSSVCCNNKKCVMLIYDGMKSHTICSSCGKMY